MPGAGHGRAACMGGEEYKAGGMIANTEFAHDWRAEALAKPPLIAPARQFTYPQQIAGEEDAMARGALLLQVHPAAGGTFSCPDPRELCAVAGGYAYIIDTAAPERSTHIPLKPVAEVLVLAEQGLL